MYHFTTIPGCIMIQSRRGLLMIVLEPESFFGLSLFDCGLRRSLDFGIFLIDVRSLGKFLVISDDHG